MNPTDYILDIALILIVVLQIRDRPLTVRSMARPLVIVSIAVASYFHSLPTAGNDLVLIGLCVALGAAIGTASGMTTHLHRGEDGTVLARAGWLAGFFWVFGMGLRFAFILWMTHGGAPQVVRFSAVHEITGQAAWTDALLGMAVGEVLSRTAAMFLRKRALEQSVPGYELA